MIIQPSFFGESILKDSTLSIDGVLLFYLNFTLAISQVIFASDMTTYYCTTIEEALRRAKIAGKKPGCFYGGITLKSGKKGFAIYREGEVIIQYSVIGR